VTKGEGGVPKGGGTVPKGAGAVAKPGQTSFTTMAQAVAYGDINQNMQILPSTMQITSSWMGDTSMVKPNAYLEYNKFKKI
jgi:hypothetical protein